MSAPIAVAVGVPGIVDPNSGMLVGLTPNLKGWAEAPVGAILTREIGVAAVVENDVNLAILGEHWKGAARGHDTCVFLTQVLEEAKEREEGCCSTIP